MSLFFFTPVPTDPEAPAGGNRLFSRYGLNRGVSVVQRQDGTFYTTRYPSALELDEAKAHWLGGYTYAIDADTATELTDAGFTITVTYPPDSYLVTYTDAY